MYKKKDREREKISAMLQFHLANKLKEHVTRIDYHYGLYRSRHTAKVCSTVG